METKKTRTERNLGRRGSDSEVKLMDEEIWKELPEDIQEAVIARLPLASFLRFRLVCRKWNSLLHSQAFLQRRGPWFYAKLTTGANTGAMYDPRMKKWHLSSNIPDLDSRRSFWSLEASAGGLVCGFDYNSKSIHVGNPLTQTWKTIELSTTIRDHPHAMAMILDQDLVSRGYRIVYLESYGDYQVYDSLNSSWDGPRRISSNINLPLELDCRGHTVCIGNVVYFLRSRPGGIVSYDTVSGAWEELLVPHPPNADRLYRLYNISLAECGGQILLVGLVREDSAVFASVWELQRAILVWKEVARTPKSWCSDISAKDEPRFSCLGNKGLLMISLSKKWKCWFFTYDVMSREWSEVPRCILPRHRRKNLIWGGSVFFPGLFLSP